MSLLFSIALAAASGATLPSCSWDKPGVNPFMGDVVAAVDRYQDIAPATRAKLKARMALRAYDDIVSIERDAIVGKAAYSSAIRQMHFGAGSICNTVTRAKWTPQTHERGLVYCEDGQCILVPTVCRNVSRITRLAASQQAMADPQTQLDMDPTGAGVRGGGEPGVAERPSFAQQGDGVSDGSSPGGLIGAYPAPGGVDGDPISPGLWGHGTPFLPPGSTNGPALYGSHAFGVPDNEIWALLALDKPWPGGVSGNPPGPGLSGHGPLFLPPGSTNGLAPLAPPVLAVPEPEPWTLLVIGLATVGVAGRRRR